MRPGPRYYRCDYCNSNKIYVRQRKVHERSRRHVQNVRNWFAQFPFQNARQSREIGEWIRPTADDDKKSTKRSTIIDISRACLPPSLIPAAAHVYQFHPRIDWGI